MLKNAISKRILSSFFSYVHTNDEHDRGRLTDLRKLLQDEIWDQTGKPFKIFQDTENIKWGQDWRKRIKESLDTCSILIAIVTPSYLVSQSCRFELEYFLNRESQSMRNLIIPILYIDPPNLNDKNDFVATEISKRQWVDWRDLRFASLTSAKVSKKLEALAKQIRELIDEKIFEDINTEVESKYSLPESVVRKMVVQAVEAPLSSPVSATLPLLYAPVVQAEDRARSSQQITVLVRPTDDWERNKRRLKILHSTLISFKGSDRFSFVIYEDGKGHLIDFPNDTTRVCPELLARLRNLLGEESWRIDEITFQ